MKKMSILIVAILILGCETETPMVEQPLSISEAPSPVAASGEHFRVDIVEPDNTMEQHRSWRSWRRP